MGLQGRIGILKVHARGKELDADVDFHKVARATAGSTGAELMNLMNQSAIVTVRQGRETITEVDIFEVSSVSGFDQGCHGVAFQTTSCNSGSHDNDSVNNTIYISNEDTRYSTTSH